MKEGNILAPRTRVLNVLQRLNRENNIKKQREKRSKYNIEIKVVMSQEVSGI